MSLHHDLLKHSLEKMPYAFALHRIVVDDRGNTCDYIFLEVNGAFEKMTGLKREDIIGKRVTEVLPGIDKDSFNWIDIYGAVALQGKSFHFDRYSEVLRRWFEVQAYSDEKGYFTTIFSETTSSRQELASMRLLLELTEKLLLMETKDFDYGLPLKTLSEMAGAMFAALNTYEEGRTKSVTRAIAGSPQADELASKVTGLDLIGHGWPIQPDRLRRIKGGKLVRFRSLAETSMGALDDEISSELQNLFKLGDLYVIELTSGGVETLGDIIFFMPQGKAIRNREAIELYARQLGSLLARLRSEEELKEKNELLQNITENMFDMISLTDPQGKFLFTGKSHERLGYGPRGLIGKNVLDFVHPDDLPPILAAFEEMLEKKQAKPIVEYRYLFADGSYRWFETLGVVINDDRGKIKELLFSTRDITERKKTEALLKEKSEELDRYFNSSLDLLCIANTKGEFVRVNPEWEKVLGYPQAELEGRSFLEFVHPDDVEATLEAMARLEAQEDILSFVNRYRCKDGSYQWIEWRARPQGEIIYSVARVVTDKRRAEEALLKLNTELDRQIKERAVVDAFTYSVSHDLRAPLRRIAGFSEMLKEECELELSESGRDYMARILSQVQLMDQLIVAMLRLSEVARHEMDLEEVDLGSIAKSHINRLRHDEPHRRVQVTVEPDLVATCDPELIRIALGNLLENAWKYSAARDITRIEFGKVDDEGGPVFYIRDNGAGFEMQYAEKLFQPFQRLHNDHEFPGTGIGLNIVHRIIIRHGGEIWAHSEPGKGATFYFSFSRTSSTGEG